MKHFNLKRRILLTLILLSGLIVLAVVVGVMGANWMGKQNKLLITFTAELNTCLHTKEKVAFLRGEFIQASLEQSPEKLKKLAAKTQNLASEISHNIDQIFGHSMTCLECHSKDEMKDLESQTKDTFNTFLLTGQKILKGKYSEKEKQAIIEKDLLNNYEDLQSFLGHGVEESQKFVEQAKQRVKKNYLLVKRFLLILGFLALGIAILGILITNYKALTPLAKMASHFKQIANDVLSITEKQSETTSKQASAIVEVSASAEELSRSAEVLNKQAEVIVQVAQGSVDKARTVGEYMETTVDCISAIKTQTDEASEKIMQLGETIDEIGKVLTLIEDVANQTRLLAFNASIEAVSAGEAGKRFSIVAKHIKDLADNTSASTEEIRKLIEEIKSLAHTAVMSTEQMQKAVDKGVSQVRMAKQGIQEVKEVIRENNEVAQKINIATSQQKTATEQITEAMEELSNTAQELAKASKKTVEAMHQLNEEASHLQKIIEG